MYVTNIIINMVILNLNHFFFQLKSSMENWDPVIAQIGKFLYSIIN